MIVMYISKVVDHFREKSNQSFNKWFLENSLPIWKKSGSLSYSTFKYKFQMAKKLGGHLVAKSCLTLRGTRDDSPPGSSIHGISQARILAWVAISFSTEFS